MAKNNFWFISLCVLLLISVCTGLNVYLRIAIGLNAVVILLDIIKRIKVNNGGKEKN